MLVAVMTIGRTATASRTRCILEAAVPQPDETGGAEPGPAAFAQLFDAFCAPVEELHDAQERHCRTGRGSGPGGDDRGVEQGWSLRARERVRLPPGCSPSPGTCASTGSGATCTCRSIELGDYDEAVGRSARATKLLGRKQEDGLVSQGAGRHSRRTAADPSALLRRGHAPERDRHESSTSRLEPSNRACVWPTATCAASWRPDCETDPSSRPQHDPGLCGRHPGRGLHRLVVASHLAWCPQCREAVRAAEALGGELLEQLPDAAVSDGLPGPHHGRAGSGATLHRLPAPPVADAAVPGPLARLLTGGQSSMSSPWKKKAPGVAMFDVKLSPTAKGQLKLLRIGPGRAVPEHGHGGEEITLVLSGAYRDHMGRFAPRRCGRSRRGHRAQARGRAGGDCICLVAIERPTRFKSFAARLMQPLVGI